MTHLLFSSFVPEHQSSLSAHLTTHTTPASLYNTHTSPHIPTTHFSSLSTPPPSFNATTSLPDHWLPPQSFGYSSQLHTTSLHAPQQQQHTASFSYSPPPNFGDSLATLRSLVSPSSSNAHSDSYYSSACALSCCTNNSNNATTTNAYSHNTPHLHSIPIPQQHSSHHHHHTHNVSSLERLVFFIDLPADDPSTRRLRDRLLLLGARVEPRLEDNVTHLITNRYFTLELMKAISQPAQTYLASSNPSSPMREAWGAVSQQPNTNHNTTNTTTTHSTTASSTSCSSSVLSPLPLSPCLSPYPSPGASSSPSSSHLYDICTRSSQSNSRDGVTTPHGASFLKNSWGAAPPQDQPSLDALATRSSVSAHLSHPSPHEHRTYLEHLGMSPEISQAFCAGKKIYHIEKFLPWLDRKYEEFYSTSSFSRSTSHSRKPATLHKSLPLPSESSHSMPFSRLSHSKSGFVCVEDLEGKFQTLYKEFSNDEEGKSTFPSLNFDAPPGLSPFLRTVPSASTSSTGANPQASKSASVLPAIHTAPGSQIYAPSLSPPAFRKSSDRSGAALPLPPMVICTDAPSIPSEMIGTDGAPAQRNSLLRTSRRSRSPSSHHHYQRHHQSSSILPSFHLHPLHLHQPYNTHSSQLTASSTPTTTPPPSAVLKPLMPSSVNPTTNTCMNNFNICTSSNASDLDTYLFPPTTSTPTLTTNAKHRLQYVTSTETQEQQEGLLVCRKRKKGQESGEEEDDASSSTSKPAACKRSRRISAAITAHTSVPSTGVHQHLQYDSTTAGGHSVPTESHHRAFTHQSHYPGQAQQHHPDAEENEAHSVGMINWMCYNSVN
eukprot:TRINITY_DN4279_c0_g1_i1.p1 TRINITY_DN4279_c0_g1~~TRINITY_DN4279_c0_g1_i1.p1  ORF type:complete len:831 (+),score=140.67 TRINITY_DN4279_c0_g1_i1:504-2996(+)